jgi:hypothetical protein
MNKDIHSEDPLYSQYCEYFRQHYNMLPHETLHTIPAWVDLKASRDEILGLFGETPLLKIIIEDGKLEESQNYWRENYSIITFEEYSSSFNI